MKMKVSLKKSLSVLAASGVLVSTVLGGCAPKTENEAVSEAAAPKKEEAKKEEAKKEITINFPTIWVGTDSKANVISQLITSFNEENKGSIKVVVEEMPDYQAYREKTKTNVIAGNAPDIFTTDNAGNTEIFYKSGKLMDFTPYLDDAWKGTFLEGTLDKEGVYEGQHLAIPYEMAVLPVMYNAKLLKQVGYDEFPKTYTEMFEMFDKLKAADLIPATQMTGENAWTSMLWYSQIVTSIGGPDVYSRGLDDPAFVEAAKVMQKMFDYTSSDAVGAGAAVPAGHFLNEKAAVFMNGPWFIGRFKKDGVEGLYDNVQIAPAPYFEGGKGQAGGYIGTVQAYLVAAKQEDKAKEEAVVKFIKYLTDPAHVAQLSKESGALFYVKTGVSDDTERIQKAMIEQSNAAPYVANHFQAAMPQKVVTEFPQALSSLALGESTPEEFVELLKAAESK
ncbi:MAG: hypothetical protein K0S71_2843 [Clostridia bacterium]|jgi:raffinose/stachyose/melibiose transport system substrate-binding protein|nr:hypothetical protein [Clostridia bacterium]